MVEKEEKVETNKEAPTRLGNSAASDFVLRMFTVLPSASASKTFNNCSRTRGFNQFHVL